MRPTADTVVIGGGPSGAAAAAYLAQAGWSVAVIERSGGPHHKVCGEFVSHEAALYLQDLNIDVERLGGIRLETLRIYAGDQVAAVVLPFRAFSLSRYVLDEELLRAASARGAVLHRGSSVRRLHEHDGRWIAAIDGGTAVSARNAVLATGKHDLGGWKRPPGTHGDLIAFKLHWRLRAEEMAGLGRGVELFVFPGGYGGLQPVEGGNVNLCLVVRRRHYACAGQRWDLLLDAVCAACPHVRQRLAGAEPCWGRPLAIAAIPYGHIQAGGAGPWFLGDQAAVIPSFSGDGLSIALHSARLAARYLAAGRSAAAYQQRLARDLGGQVRRATLVSRMLVSMLGQPAMMLVARMVPGLVGIIARDTRIPDRSLKHAWERHAVS